MTFIYVSLYFVYILFDTTEVNQNIPDSDIRYLLHHRIQQISDICYIIGYSGYQIFATSYETVDIIYVLHHRIQLISDICYIIVYSGYQIFFTS
jgi:hypothetical protein